MKPLALSAWLTAGLPLAGLLIFAFIWFQCAHWEETAVPSSVTDLAIVGLILILATPVPFCFAVYYFLRDKPGKAKLRG